MPTMRRVVWVLCMWANARSLVETGCRKSGVAITILAPSCKAELIEQATAECWLRRQSTSWRMLNCWCRVGEIEMVVWWRYKCRSESEGAVERERTKLCVVQGSLRHNACVMGLQPSFPCEILQEETKPSCRAAVIPVLQLLSSSTFTRQSEWPQPNRHRGESKSGSLQSPSV